MSSPQLPQRADGPRRLLDGLLDLPEPILSSEVIQRQARLVADAIWLAVNGRLDDLFAPMGEQG